ncbi:MAG: metal-dependent hydrolase, partial [Solirubrobacteraceae bacterium]
PSRNALQVRRPSFELPDLPHYWFGGDAFATHYMNALSSVFPDGEAFFVRSVQRYRDRIQEPELLRAIQGFAGQEAQHSHQHDFHLELLVAQGYTGLVRGNRVADRIMRLENRHLPRFSLASTAAVEHLTALLARRILADDARFTALMDPRMAALWRWHSVEEAEHKAVAFDVLQEVAPSRALRAFALALNSVGLFVEMLARTLYMLAKDGVLFRRATLASGWRFLFGREGLLRGHGHSYLAWYRRGFHPAQIDDSPLIAAWGDRIGVSTTS